MAKSLANLRTLTRVYLDETIQADFLTSNIDVAINEFYMKTVTAVMTVYEDYYSNTSTITTVDDTQEYDLPSDFYKMRRVEINYAPSTTGSTSQRALPITLDEVRGRLSSTSTGPSVSRNSVYYVIGDKIGFLPIPSDGGTDAVDLWYIKQISELSESTDVIDIPFPDRYGPAIALGAAGLMLRQGQIEESAAQRYLLDFEVQIEKMQAELRERIADDVKGVTDTLGECVDFSTPF